MAGQAENSGSGPFAHGGMTGAGIGGLGTRHYCGMCSGLIPALGDIFAKDSKICHCAKQLGPAPATPDILKKWWENEPQEAAAAPAMTSHDFVVWLRGFFTGRSVLPTDPELEALLRATLDKVKP